MSETVIAADSIIESPRRSGLGVRPPAAVMAPAGFAKNTAQGACAGLLTLAGATQFSGAALTPELATLFAGGTSIETLGMQLVMGNFTGILQIIGAAALFLTAGRGLGRVLGLMMFVAAATAYFNGIGPSELLARSQEIYQALGPAYETFQENLMTVSQSSS
ncbi:MAG: hypothetical protein AAGD92_05230 [Pseudomonadota bacterium]